jgi:hypothetical protein
MGSHPRPRSASIESIEKEDRAMKKPFVRISHVLLASIVMCGLVQAEDVTYDFDKTTNFGRLHSFAFQEGDARSDNPFVNERIADSITGELRLRGMSHGDRPDVYITTKLATEIRKEVLGWSYDGWWGPGWHSSHVAYAPYGWGWGGPVAYEVRDVRYDTLTIDMVDAATGKLLWRGTGTREVDPDWSPAKLDKKVNKMVVKILENFPPDWDDD